MRMNRGTVLLLAASLIVIVGVLLVTIYQAAAPGEDDVSDSPEGAVEVTEVALFPGVDAASIARLEVRDNQTGERTVLFKQDDLTWGMDDFTGQDRDQNQSGAVIEATEDASAEVQSTIADIDEIQVDALLGNALQLASADTFEADDLSEFGLDTPDYSVFAVDESGLVYVLYVGGQNPAGTRYYGVIEQIAPGDTSPNLPAMEIDLDRAEEPSSVDGIIVPGQSGTEEATAEAGATEAADSDETQEAVAQNVERAEIETSIDADETQAVSTEESTPVPAADEALLDVTVEPVDEPLVMLDGPQTVYLLPKPAIDALIGILTAPPLAPPTPTPEPVFDIVPPELSGTVEPSPDSATPEADATEAATAEA